MVPYDDKSPFITSGIRLGVPALTTRGLLEGDMEHIANWIDTILLDPENEQTTLRVKGEINEFMSAFTLYLGWKI
jgi:glycine hydroxymethyltransferase